MKTKQVKNYRYDGLGFPVALDQVQMIQLEGEWHPKIDVKQVADITIKALAYQKERLTGNQVKFIRTYFSMSLRKFGSEVVHETHAAVDKWEKCGNQATMMNQNTEYVLRLFIIEQIYSKTKAEQHDFFKKYQTIKNFFKSNSKTTPHMLHIANFA